VDQRLTAIFEAIAPIAQINWRNWRNSRLVVNPELRHNLSVASSTDIGTLITQSADICAGRPRVSGTAVSVMRIAGWHRLGCSPEEIARKTALTLAQIHAALAYYHANRHAIDSELDNEASEYDGLANEHRSKPH